MNSGSAPPRSQPPTIASSRSRRSTRRAASPNFKALASQAAEYDPVHTAALHAPGGDTINVDPGAPFLGPAASYAEAGPSSPTSSRRGSKKFVGGFVSVVKKVMGQQGGDLPQRHPEEGYLPNTSLLNGREHEAHRSPTYAAHVGSIHNDVTHISPASSSNTHHDSLESQTNDEGATLVGHEMLPPPRVIGSPVFVEPRPGSDYAKMDSPRHSIASLGSYVYRIRQFFSELNALPWVADRVTVDYIPGKERGRRHIRPTSWYGGVAQPGHRHSVDLFSDTTSSTSTAARQGVLPILPYHSTQPEVIFRIQSPNAQTANLPYAYVVPASYSLGPSAPPAPPTYTMPPAPPISQDRPRVAIQSPQHTPSSEPTTQQQPTPQPLPQSTPAHSPPVAAFRPYGETFPLGYVSYQQQEAAAEHYGDLSVHGLSYVPRIVSSTSGTATQPSRPVSSGAHPSRPVSATATPRASRPPSAAANPRPHTPHTPAALQYPYPVSTAA